MKTYRIVYWFSTSIFTERYFKAANEREAARKFRDEVGDRRIINIEEVA